MLTATILALVAAVLHALWNLSIKQSISDRFLALSYSGNINGAGNLTKTGGGTLTLSGSVDHTGQTTIGAGTLEIANAGSLTRRRRST